MRPPPIRLSLGPTVQIRPIFGAPSLVVPCPKRVAEKASRLNSDNLFKQNCQRGHEQLARPLLEVNRFRGQREAGFGHEAPAPKLARRPNVKAPILVRTWM